MNKPKNENNEISLVKPIIHWTSMILIGQKNYNL